MIDVQRQVKDMIKIAEETNYIGNIRRYTKPGSK